jgi:PAS domain-containing protein
LEKHLQTARNLIKSELNGIQRLELLEGPDSVFTVISKLRVRVALSQRFLPKKRQFHSLVRDLRGNDRRVLEDADVKSILFVPIKIRDDIWGVVGFLESTYERIWSQKEIRALEIGSSLIGSARMRFEAGERLEKSEKQFRTLAQNIPGIVFRLSLAGSDMEFYNDHLEAVTGYTAR